MKNLILFFFISVFFVSCSSDTYNVQLLNGSIVEARNDLNTYSYKPGDTVCVRYSDYFEQYVFDDEMKDTIVLYTGYRADSTFYSYTSEYRIGIIK